MKQNGFSLMELVVVLVIIGLALSLVTPSLNRLSKTIELKASAREISGMLRYYRSDAIQKRQTHQILFDQESRELKVLLLPLEEEKTKEEENGKRMIKKTYSLPTGIRFKEIQFEPSQTPSPLPAIEFYPGGGSNGGYFHLDTPDHKGYRIKVHFVTGIVEVEES